MYTLVPPPHNTAAFCCRSHNKTLLHDHDRKALPIRPKCSRHRAENDKNHHGTYVAAVATDEEALRKLAKAQFLEASAGECIVPELGTLHTTQYLLKAAQGKTGVELELV